MSTKKVLPTEKELEILKIIWAEGPCTVRFVNDQLNREKKVGYTTTLKLMQIMVDKNILKRDEEQRSHVYKALHKEKETIGRMMNRFLEKVFSGSTPSFVMQALGSRKTTKKEIDEIKAFLDKLEREGRVE